MTRILKGVVAMVNEVQKESGINTYAIEEWYRIGRIKLLVHPVVF